MTSKLEHGGWPIGGDDVGDDFAFVRADIHKKILSAAKFVDGCEDGFRGLADLRELGVVGDEREELVFAAVAALSLGVRFAKWVLMEEGREGEWQWRYVLGVWLGFLQRHSLPVCRNRCVNRRWGPLFFGVKRTWGLNIQYPLSMDPNCRILRKTTTLASFIIYLNLDG